MKYLPPIILASLIITTPLLAQIKPNNADAIRELLLNEKVARNVFFHYDTNDWHGDLFPPPGDYAFICPDTSFRKVYPNILNELPYALNTDGVLYMKAFYKDSVKSIYINGTAGVEVNIVFTEINIGPTEAEISFFTTAWFDFKRFENRYVNVVGILRKRHGKWRVRNVQVEPIPWKDYFKEGL